MLHNPWVYAMDAMKYVVLSADAVEVLVNELRDVRARCRPGDILLARVIAAVEKAFDKGSVSVAVFDAEALDKAIEAPAPRRYGEVSWDIEDVREQVRDSFGDTAEISDEDCEAILELAEVSLQDVMTERGWSMLEHQVLEAERNGVVSVINADGRYSTCAKCGVRFLLEDGNPVHSDPEISADDCAACDRDHTPYSL